LMGDFMVSSVKINIKRMYIWFYMELVYFFWLLTH
jgi:hypothetical protein